MKTSVFQGKAWAIHRRYWGRRRKKGEWQHVRSGSEDEIGEKVTGVVAARGRTPQEAMGRVTGHFLPFAWMLGSPWIVRWEVRGASSPLSPDVGGVSKRKSQALAETRERKVMCPHRWNTIFTVKNTQKYFFFKESTNVFFITILYFFHFISLSCMQSVLTISTGQTWYFNCHLHAENCHLFTEAQPLSWTTLSIFYLPVGHC